jgi:putrescine aminotransferase
VAAFIAEPVQGAGGVIIPPGHLLARDPAHRRQVRHLADQRRGDLRLWPLGHWFAYEKFGYKPDLVTFAKAVTSGYIPLGGVMVGDRVAKVLIEQGGEFNHGYTYSGHPVACAVAPGQHRRGAV